MIFGIGRKRFGPGEMKSGGCSKGQCPSTARGTITSIFGSKRTRTTAAAATAIVRWCRHHPRQRHPRQKGHLHRQSHRQAWHRSRRHLPRTALAVSSATPRWTEHGGVQHGARGGQTQRNLKLEEVASCLIEAEVPHHSIVQYPAPATVTAVLCALVSQKQFNIVQYSTVSRLQCNKCSGLQCRMFIVCVRV